MIPKDIKKAIDGHVDHGYSTGGFVYAVLCNDLAEAMARADIDSRFTLGEICNYVFNLTPAPCWGTGKKVKAWRKLHKENPVGAERIAAADREQRQKY